MVTKQKTAIKSKVRKVSQPKQRAAMDSASVRVLTLGFTLLSMVFAALAFVNYG